MHGAGFTVKAIAPALLSFTGAGMVGATVGPVNTPGVNTNFVLQSGIMVLEPLPVAVQ